MTDRDAEPELCALALQGVPRPTVLKIAANARRVPADLRGLLLAVLAEPEDAACLGALRDYIEARQPRPDQPPTLNVGGECVGVGEPKSPAWWDSLSPNGRTRLFPFCFIAHMARRTRMPDALFSFADVLSLTPEDVMAIPGMGEKRRRLLFTTVHNLGFFFRGETASLFQGAT